MPSLSSTRFDVGQGEARRLELFDLHTSHELSLAAGAIAVARVDLVRRQQAQFVVMTRRARRDAQALGEPTNAQ